MRWGSRAEAELICCTHSGPSLHGVFQAGARAPFCWDLAGAFGHGGRTLACGPETSEVPGEGRDENMIWRLLFSVEVQNSFFAVNSYWLVISPCRQGLFLCIWK